jgi:hypothetical protein
VRRQHRDKVLEKALGAGDRASECEQTHKPGGKSPAGSRCEKKRRYNDGEPEGRFDKRKRRKGAGKPIATALERQPAEDESEQSKWHDLSGIELDIASRKGQNGNRKRERNADRGQGDRG